MSPAGAPSSRTRCFVPSFVHRVVPSRTRRGSCSRGSVRQSDKARTSCAAYPPCRTLKGNASVLERPRHRASGTGKSEGFELGMPRESAQEPLDWVGTARYEVLRRIARGAMGSVYEAFDRERRQRVAIKTLRHSGPTSLFMFKNEFRTLFDVSHPNLVRLYELVATEGERIFFSMELVHGTDFVSYTRQSRASAPDGIAEGVRPLISFDRLRSTLRQLVLGLQALHEAGKLHRDIKPSNVLVTPEGRVVILDFGVATGLPRVTDDSLRPPDSRRSTSAIPTGMLSRSTPSTWISNVPKSSKHKPQRAARAGYGMIV